MADTKGLELANVDYSRRAPRKSIDESAGDLSYEASKKTLNAGRVFTKHPYGRGSPGRRIIWFAEKSATGGATRGFLFWNKVGERETIYKRYYLVYLGV